MSPTNETGAPLVSRHAQDGSPASSHGELDALKLALAFTVASPQSHASVLDEDNRLIGRTSISEAVENDLCFFVEVDSAILAVDFDEGDAEDRARELYGLLRVRGYLPVMVASGRSGHRHVFCRLPSEVRDSVVREAGLSRMEVRRTIRPPLAAHRRREPVQLLLPEDPRDALARLDGSHSGRPLGEKALSALARTEPRRDSSVSEVVFSLAMGTANAGWSVEEFLELLRCTRFGIQKLFARRQDGRGEQETVRWAREQVWTAAVAKVEANPAQGQGPSARIISTITWAMTSPWPGRTGPTDRAIYLALLHKRLLSGASEFDASQRELCLLAGISSKPTVEKSLERLASRGLVRRHRRRKVDGPPRPRLSDAWELTGPEDADLPPADHRSLNVLDLLGEDAFRNRVGLGKAVEHLYAVITCWPGNTVKQLSQVVHRRESWIRDKVRILRDLGLVDSDGDGGWALGPVAVEVSAKELGSAGRRARQQEQFERQREFFDRPPDRWSR